jgi:LPXTG-site transpeptidase (sortase) family protein
VLGRIRIPAIKVDDYFVEGVGEDQLQEGPGRYPGSGLPGQEGNLAIAGHRTTYGAPFFRLGELGIGDEVIIDTPEGRATYTVADSPFAVSPYDVDVLNDFGDARLTLTTCNPPFLATTRLIVVAKLSNWLPTGAPVPLAPVAPPVRPLPTTAAVTSAASATTGPVATASSTATARFVAISRVARRLTGAPAPGPGGTGPSPDAAPPVAAQARGPQAGQVGVDEDSMIRRSIAGEGNGWHLASLPVVLVVVIALCALGATYRRVARLCVGVSRWLVMVPMWAAGLLILFRVLGLLLPADL